MSWPGVLRFEEFEFDPANHVLTRNGVVVKLAPQPFKILSLLIDGRGTLVTRAMLQAAVWGDDTVVDFEHGLNTCIRHIRLALGDDADVPRFIETVPRLGYRFTAAVTEKPKAARPSFRWQIAVGAAGLVVIGSLMAWVVSRNTRPSSTSEARDLYLRGHLALEDPTSASARTALALFEKALTADPAYAPAEVGIAKVYLQKPSSIPDVSPKVAVSKAQRAIDDALVLDDSLPETHLASAELRMTLHDWPAAGREYQRVIELAPNDSSTRQEYARWLSYQARFDEALKEARIGESLDPLSAPARNTVAEVLRHARRFDEAIVQAKRALELNPNFGRAHTILGHCYLAQGRLDEAIDEHQKSGLRGGNLGSAYALAGRTDEARRILEGLKKRYASTQGGSGEIAQVYIGLHESDRAFEWLSRAVDDGSIWTLRVAAVWDPIRSDPRFEQLLRKSGYGN